MSAKRKNGAYRKPTVTEKLLRMSSTYGKLGSKAVSKFPLNTKKDVHLALVAPNLIIWRALSEKQFETLRKYMKTTPWIGSNDYGSYKEVVAILDDIHERLKA